LAWLGCARAGSTLIAIIHAVDAMPTTANAVLIFIAAPLPDPMVIDLRLSNPRDRRKRRERSIEKSESLRGTIYLPADFRVRR
jgi:hypothetical protein